MKSQSLVCVYIGCVEARDRVIATFGNAFEDVSMSDAMSRSKRRRRRRRGQAKEAAKPWPGLGQAEPDKATAKTPRREIQDVEIQDYV